MKVNFSFEQSDTQAPFRPLILFPPKNKNKNKNMIMCEKRSNVFFAIYYIGFRQLYKHMEVFSYALSMEPR